MWMKVRLVLFQRGPGSSNLAWVLLCRAFLISRWMGSDCGIQSLEKHSLKVEVGQSSLQRNKPNTASEGFIWCQASSNPVQMGDIPCLTRTDLPPYTENTFFFCRSWIKGLEINFLSCTCLLFLSLLAPCVCTKDSVSITFLVAKMKYLNNTANWRKVYFGSWFEGTVHYCEEGGAPGMCDS